MILFLILSFGTICLADWRLVFNDDFNERKTIDDQKWEIVNEDYSCNGNYLKQLHCKTNSENNVRILNETLVLAAVRQTHLNKNYTSAQIKVKQQFTYGRIEIRAALPKGKMLRPVFYLLPVYGQEKWPEFGEIDIMFNHQTDSIQQIIHYKRPDSNDYSNISNEFIETENINDFHTYSMEWFPQHISWEFDGQLLKRLDMNWIFNDSYQPFSKPFNLFIDLGVGGERFFLDQKLSFDDSDKWECSLLIIDFVRIYQDTNVTNVDRIRDRHNKSPNEICKQIMSLIRLENKKNQPQGESGFGISAIISVSSFLLLIIFIGFVIFLFIRFNALNRNVNQSQIASVTKANEQENHYDDINYQEIDNNKINQNNVYLEVFD